MLEHIGQQMGKHLTLVAQHQNTTMEYSAKVLQVISLTIFFAKDILELTNGSIVELDKLAGEPVDINVNGKFLAKGEVVVIDENFGVRITEIASPAERAAKLQ